MSGSQAERRVLIPAGGIIPVRVPGDFIFIKFSDRPVIVRIDGQAIVMRAGDRRKIERSAGNPMAPAFDIFELENPSADAALAVEFVAGEGDYSSQIINGEVVIAPGIRRADGRWYDDTRRTVSMRLALSSIEAVEHLKYDRELTYGAGPQSPNGNLWGVIGDAPGRVMASHQGSYHSVWDMVERTREELPWYPAEGASCPVYVDGKYYAFSKGAPTGGGGGHVVYLLVLAGLSAGTYLNTADFWANVRRVETQIPCKSSAYTLRADGAGQLVAVGDVLYANIIKPNESSYTLIKLDLHGNLLAERSIGSVYYLGVQGDVIHKSGTGSSFDDWVAAYSAEDLSDADITLPSSAQLGQYQIALGMMGPRHLIGWNAWEGGPAIRKWAAESWTDSARGTVAACNGAGMFVADAAPTDAAMTLVRDASGRPVASGQLIKAALDIYLGEAGGYVAADYLDHIYGVEFEYANYLRPLSIQTGGSSFLRSGIADNFQNVPLPQRIKITADADLVSEFEAWNS